MISAASPIARLRHRGLPYTAVNSSSPSFTRSTPRQYVFLDTPDCFVNAAASWRDSLDHGNGDFLLAARVSTVAEVMRRLSQNAGVPHFSDAFGRVAFDVTPTLRMHANALWAQDTLRIDDDDEDARFTSTSGYLWSRADWAPSETLGVSFWLGRSQLDSSRDGEVDKDDLLTGVAHDLRHGTSTDLRAQLDWQPDPDHRVSAGADWASGRAHYDYASEVSFADDVAELFARGAEYSRAIDLRLRSRQLGVFVSDQWHISDRWSSEIGLRAQRIRYSGGGAETTLDPRLSVRVMLLASTTLRLHWGRFHQSDEANDLHVEDGVTQPAAARRSEHAIIGIEHEWRGGLRARLEMFRKRGVETRTRHENLLNRLALPPELSPDRVALAPGTSDADGFEMSFNYERDDWSSWLSLVRSSATDENRMRESPRSWDQPEAAQLGTSWSCGPWVLSAAFAWHTGFPTTSIITQPDGTSALGRPYAARLPAFASLDLHAEYRRPLARGGLVVTLDISNAANRRNVCCTDVEVEGEEMTKIFADPQRGMPLTPIAGNSMAVLVA